MGVCCQRKQFSASAAKESSKNNYNSDDLAHTEPVCKRLRILKSSYMISVAIWKFYYKLMNNKLSEFFSSMKPALQL